MRNRDFHKSLENQLIHEVRQRGTRVFILDFPEKLILIDAGLKNRESTVVDKIKSLGRNISDVELIIITHAHSDHTGGLLTLSKLSDAKVICQRNEADAIRQGRNSIMDFHKPFLTKIISPLALKEKIPKANPDIVYDDELGLADYGLNAKVIHTPGHTKGASSIVFDNGIAFIGDIVMDIMGLQLTPITYDREILKDSLQKLLEMNIHTFYLSHGGKHSRAEIEKLI